MHANALRSGRPTGGRPPENPGQQQGLETAYYGSQSGQQDWSTGETEERSLIDISRNPPEGTVWRVTLQVDGNVRCNLDWGGGAASLRIDNLLSSTFAVPGRFTLRARKLGNQSAIALCSVLPAQGAPTGARVLAGAAGGGNALLPRGAVRFTAAVAATVVEVFGAGSPTAALAAGQTVEVSSGGSVTAGWGFAEVVL